jgi:hypothetical protein
MDAADGPAPPVDPSTLLPQMIRYYFSEELAPDPALGLQLMNAGCPTHQIVSPLQFSSTELDLKLSIRSVARAFNIDHFQVKLPFCASMKMPPAADDIGPFLPKLNTQWCSGSPRRHMITKLPTGQNY